MNARSNPFRVERVLERLRFDPGWLGTSWEAIMERARGLGYRAAIRGPHGTGKTTLLEDLGERLERKGFRVRMIKLWRENRKLPEAFRERRGMTFGPSDLVLLDGAEQLGPVTWQRLRARTRAAGGLIVTQHRAGRLPNLIRTATSAGMLEAFARELAGPEWPGIGSIDFADLLRRHGGNVRHALRECYDIAAGLPNPRRAASDVERSSGRSVRDETAFQHSIHPGDSLVNDSRIGSFTPH